GKSEGDIVEDLKSIIVKLVEKERVEREKMMQQSEIRMENQIFRSYGILKHARIIESKEDATRLPNVRLGIDLGIIKNVSHSILNELMVLTQPGFLKHYAK